MRVTVASLVYNRLFTKILDSSIWLEPDSTRIVWVTLLASMNEDGYCHFSALENLASRARVSRAKAKRAIEKFESPDLNSENLTNEGRRIERVPGGYLVLNAKYYREKFSREIERERTRIRVQRHREKTSKSNEPTVTKPLHSVSTASASSSVQKEEKGNKGKPENREVVLGYVKELGLPETDGHYYFDKWQGNGCKNAGKAILDWKAVIRSHKSAGYCPSQKKTQPSLFQKPKIVDPNQQRRDDEYERHVREKNERAGKTQV